MSKVKCFEKIAEPISLGLLAALGGAASAGAAGSSLTHRYGGKALAAAKAALAETKLGRNADKNFGLTDLSALNYVPFCLKVHYIDDMEVSVREVIKALKYPLRILRDGQGILAEDGKYTFMGDGEEVKIN